MKRTGTHILALLLIFILTMSVLSFPAWSEEPVPTETEQPGSAEKAETQPEPEELPPASEELPETAEEGPEAEPEDLQLPGAGSDPQPERIGEGPSGLPELPPEEIPGDPAEELPGTEEETGIGEAAAPETLTELSIAGPARAQSGLEYVLTLTDADRAIDPALAVWSVSDPELASVTGQGVFTGMKPGYVTVRAESAEANRLWAEIGITVIPATKYILTDNSADFSEEVARTEAGFDRDEPCAMEKAEKDEFELMRLLAECTGTLPDLTPWNPETVLLDRDGMLVIQFSTVAETRAAYEALKKEPSLKDLMPDSVMKLDVWETIDTVGDDTCDGIGEIIGEQERSYTGSYNDQSGMKALNIPAFAANAVSVSRSITVAVLDTGIYRNHEMFSGHYDDNGYDYVRGKPLNHVDEHGHGTHVAGTVVDTTRGFNVYVRDYRVLNASGKGTTSNIVNAIRRAADEGCEVINMSLSGSYTSSGYSMYKKAISYAAGKGSVVCCSAGNDSKNTSKVVPACVTVSGCIVVSSVKAGSGTPDRSDFSNYGSSVDVCAPGELIKSAAKNGGYTYMSGTSQACPHIAGICAIIRLYTDRSTPAQVESYLRTICVDLGAAGKDKYYGSGIPDMAALLSQYQLVSASVTQSGINSYGKAVAGFCAYTGNKVEKVILCSGDGEVIKTLTEYTASSSGRKWTYDDMVYTEDGAKSYRVYPYAEIPAGSGTIAYTGIPRSFSASVQGTYISSLTKTTAATEVKKGSAVKFTLVTNRYTPYLHLYNGSGKLLASWKASSYSKLKNGQRTWTVSYKYSTVGLNQSYLFRGAQKTDDYANQSGRSAPAVHVFGGISVTSAAFGTSTALAGTPVTITVKTPKAADTVCMYTSAATLSPAATWTRATAANKVSGSYRIWTLKYTFTSTGSVYATRYFRCSSDGGENMGLNKSAKVMVGTASDPAVGYAKPAATTVTAGKTLKITVKTTANADGLGLFLNGSETRAAYWKASDKAKSVNGELVWTLSVAFGSKTVGTNTIRFYAYTGSSKGSRGWENTIKVKK